ncbi:Hemolysin-type calcium-binding region domain protein OS=Rhodopirellula maiorica SM1 GN=RMSM_03614 PE=4 SV=1: VCBS: VCBS [Gemmata massiliana]|uniref:Uncharacterized protein n=1 Tax=Gemmata massiliana TaxID=1210884 RepID=A0A6P2CVP9_9BACT|nr:FG-GAP-like repeat-containing protein [Gemmata massiliana]VTR93051.1 Hemolysin-type calcium-binding region domain protein OS=Rhodopirellula maiorica SM1 GN=RMSM_03614 PE=4 SV=1: VCBS: VCBS [Gemmata massiliana]
MNRSPTWIRDVWGRLFTAPPRAFRRRALLQVTALEDRTTPATFVQSGSNLDLDLNTGSTGLTVASAGATYTLTLSVGTWTSSNITGATGSGTNVLTVTADTFAALNLTDSATGCTVNFSGTGNTYTDDFNVTLNDSPGAVFFTGTTTAFGAANLSINTVNAVVLNGTGVALTSSTGNITLTANVQATPTSGNLDGIGVSGGASIQITGSGALTLQGRGGDDSTGAQLGVAVFNGGQVIGGTGAVTITGTGGASAGIQNFGVYIDGLSQITSAGGNVSVTGAGGGTGASSQNAGLFIGGGSQLSAGGAGTVSVTGTGGAASGAGNHGVSVGSAAITSSGGAVTVTGTAGATGAGIQVAGTGAITTATNGGDLTLTTDAINLITGATVAASAADAVILRPLTPGLGIDLGGAGGGNPLVLTDALLDTITAGTIRIGGTGTGAVTITAPITRSAPTNVVLTGSSVTGAVAGTDLDLNGRTLSFGTGTALASTITGTTPDTGYDQLSVTGSVNLSGVGVSLAGPFVPTVGAVFNLVSATVTVSGSFGPALTTLNSVTLQTGATATTGFVAFPVPVTIGLPPQTMQVGGAPVAVNLSAFFTAPATPVVYTVVGNTSPVTAAANVGGSLLTLTGLAAGTTNITVRLTDANGQFVDSTFTFTVTGATTATPTKLLVSGAGGSGGRISIYNADGSVKVTLTPFAGFAGSVVTANGDVNNDGTPDVIVGTAAGPAHVKVFDGATGTELFSFLAFGGYLGGTRVASGDVNNDGVDDIIVGSATGASHVKVFDGTTGATIRSFFAFADNNGVTVGSGDINGDGFDDIIVGAAAGSSLVRVFNGQNATQLLQFEAFAGFTGGINVAGGDLDGNGRSEVLVGANVNGHVKAFGADGGLRLSFLAYPNFRGAARVGSVDTNGDGKADIVTGVGPGAGPHVKRFDGQTLAELSSFFAFDPSFTGGIFVG